MKNISMKNIYSFAFGLALLAGFAVSAPQAHAAFNDGSLGLDCPTVGVNTVAGGCAASSVTATPGGMVNVLFYVHNTNVNTAHGVVLHLSPQTTGAVTSQVFSGTIASSDNGGASGSGTINIGSAQTLTYSNVQWYDHNGSIVALPSGQNGSEIFGNGLSLGDIPGYGQCPRDSSGGRDVYCFQGWVKVAFQVSNTTVVTTPCTVHISAATNSVWTGNPDIISWNADHCSSINVNGPGVSVASTTVFSGSQNSAPLTQNPSVFTISGSGSTGPTATDSTTVTVTNPTGTTCSISNFSAYPPSITSGASSTLSWSSNCASISVTGSNGAFVSSSINGPATVTPAYTTTYSITGTSSTGTTATASPVTVSVNTIINNNTLSASTNAATGVTTNSATLNGYIYANNSGSCGYYCPNSNGTYYFQYGTSQYGLYSQTPTQTFYNNSGPVSAYLNNLQPNTNYYFQLIANGTNGAVYGGTLSFVTTGGAVTAITSVATNVASTSARLNGIVTAPQGTNGVTAHFEYGTTTGLGLRTTDQAVSNYTAINYFDTITTSPSTTYYYRIVGVSNGQSYYGATVPFTTPGAGNGGTVVITQVTGTGGGSAFVSLSIDDQVQTVNPGNSLLYTVKYKNISNTILSNAILNIVLPQGVIFRQASQGVLTTNNTIAVNVGTIRPGDDEATITVMAESNTNINPGDSLVATATLAFTLPSKAQDTAIAYDIDTVVFQNSLAGLALFGTGFFPNSLFGWIILLLLILILVLIARYFYHRGNAQRMAPQPMTHVHYDTAPRSPMSDRGYPDSNLPH